MALTTPHKQTVHHKKTKGAHHRHSKHYLKTYSPYLPLLLIVIIGLAINTIWTSRIGVLGESTNLTSSALLESSNLERGRNQVADLKVDQSLSAAAQTKAQDMVDTDYWSHNTPSGKSPWTFLSASGYAYEAAGENLAYGFSNAPMTIDGWMNSKHHRDNLLNTSFSEVGFGIASSDNYIGKGPATVIVALYGRPATSAAGAASGIASTQTSQSPPLRTVSRIQMITGGQAPWSFALLMAGTFAALALFVYRHARIWHRVFVKSESFIVHHKMLDIVLVTYGIAGYILTRAAGYIQ